MRALNVPEPGARPAVSDLPVPEVTDGHVLVRVKNAALNPVDKSLVAGVMAETIPHAYPLVVGRDASGVVEAVGKGVDHVVAGDEVLGHVPLAPPVQAGTLAEYALFPAASVTAKPAGLDFATAAALPLAGATAHASVEALGVKPGQAVLVVGATGGVGSYAVQLLTARGIAVVATGTPADTGRLTALGAATVVDHTSATPVADQVTAACPGGVDGLIDLVAASPDALPLSALRKGGKVASTLNAADDHVLAAAGLSGSNIIGNPVREIVAPLAALAAEGTLKTDIAEIFPLDRAADALTALTTGHAHGKILIRVAD